MCAATQRFTYGISRQEPVAVNCFVDSDPAEVSFRWAFNSSEGVVKDISEGELATCNRLDNNDKTRQHFDLAISIYYLVLFRPWKP